MRVLRWVFVALYVVIIGAFAVLCVTEDTAPAMLVFLGAIIATQLLLIFGSGTVRLCYPLRRRRLLLPVAIASLMLAALVGGLFIAGWELFKLDKAFDDDLLSMVFFGTTGLSWIVWGMLLFAKLKNRPRYAVLSRITTYLFAGSLAELLATVPSHVIVSRRPGCLVGIGTAIGITAGICVMFVSFGPGIVVLFLRPSYRAETSAGGTPYCPACGYDLRASQHRCPECGLPFENAPEIAVP
jgi:hypothetical protein